jgi:tripartite-type tricarboxylate transporter receptor subunit TctC
MNPPVNRRQTLAALASGAAALGGLAPLGALAQANYPSKPIRVVVPYAPGGATDILGRMVAAKLQEAWGQTVVVENKPGASGVLGNDAVAKATPDGYTVLLGITAMVQLATLMKLPYDPAKDFIPLTQLAVSTSVLAVPAATPAKTLAEYIALVKSQPGKHGYGSFGAGTSAHIQGELFKSQTGTDMVHVPYKGSAPMVNDLLGGQLSCAFLDVGSSRGHFKSGALRPLAATGTERLKILPDVPTFGESGLKHFEPRGWFAYFLPAGTPAPVVAKLAAELARIIRLPDVSARIDELGLLPVGNTPEQFAAIVRSESVLYAKLIKDLNIKIE